MRTHARPTPKLGLLRDRPTPVPAWLFRLAFASSSCLRRCSRSFSATGFKSSLISFARGRPGPPLRTDAESETEVDAAGAADQPSSRRALTRWRFEVDDGRRLRVEEMELDALRRLLGRSVEVEAVRVREEVERAMPAMLPDEVDVEGCGRFAAQWFVIESILAKLRLWWTSKACLLPFSGLGAVPFDLPVPKRVVRNRVSPSASAAARASATRRFISSIICSAADLPASIESGAGAAVASEAVELVERAPGMEKVKVEVGADGIEAGGGEPKTKAGGDIGRLGTGGAGSSPASDVA